MCEQGYGQRVIFMTSHWSVNLRKICCNLKENLFCIYFKKDINSQTQIYTTNLMDSIFCALISDIR